jgi:hypothetical protein
VAHVAVAEYLDGIDPGDPGQISTQGFEELNIVFASTEILIPRDAAVALISPKTFQGMDTHPRIKAKFRHVDKQIDRFSGSTETFEG